MSRVSAQNIGLSGIFMSNYVKKGRAERRPAIKRSTERCLPLRASDVAFGNDVYCVNDVTPDGVVGKHYIIATIGSNIIMSEANNITFAQAKTSFFYRPKVKRKYNTLHLAGKEVCKKDEENLVLFELNIKLLYGRYPKPSLFRCYL